MKGAVILGTLLAVREREGAACTAPASRAAAFTVEKPAPGSERGVWRFSSAVRRPT